MTNPRDLYLVDVPGEQPEFFATDKAAEEYILDLAADFRSDAAAEGEWSTTDIHPTEQLLRDAIP